MKTYTCIDFDGRWPVGVAAVIKADSEDEARALLNAELVAKNLSPLKEDAKIKLLRKRGAYILRDGDY